MDDIINRAIQLKDKLLTFTLSKDFEQDRKQAWLQRFKTSDISIHYKEEYLNFLDYFIHEWHFKDGTNIIELFIRQSKNLDNVDIEILKNWYNVISSIFQIQKISKDKFLLLNLVNNKEYLVKPIFPLNNIETISKNDFFITRIIPLGEYYIFTGVTTWIPSKYKIQVYQLVIDFLKRCPEALFIDNEEELNQAYTIQEEEYNDFIKFFGTDEIILSGKEIEQKLKEFYHYRYFQKKDPLTKKTKAELFQKKFGHLPPLPTLNLPIKLLDSPDVGMIYDKREGLNFLVWYGLFKEIFSSPNFKEIPGYKELVLGYLESQSISALPFIRIAYEYPQNLANVFMDIFDLHEFILPQDLDKILRKYKPNYHKVLPAIIPAKGKIKHFLQSQKIGRNSLCPCGSGKIYKRCCGEIRA